MLGVCDGVEVILGLEIFFLFYYGIILYNIFIFIVILIELIECGGWFIKFIYFIDNEYFYL